MQLSMTPGVAEGYSSPCQIARRISEKWGVDNLYCAACDSARLQQMPTNTQAIDYQCACCGAHYQLKSSARWSDRSVPDAGYAAMMSAIASGRTPNLCILHYSHDWRVRNLLLVPSFFFTPSAIEKRRPLGEHARRAGWVGCNILLGAIAPEGKLRIIRDGAISDPCEVRALYRRVEPLSKLDLGLRGWALDVLRLVRGLNRREFTLDELYALEPTLAGLHPRNNNIRPKMRQQLQVLRDLGLIDFLGGGRYAVRV